MELGSEFNLPLSELSVKQSNLFTYLSEYHNNIYFDSGRSALRHLSSYIKPGEQILLPEFICESVTNCFRKEDIRFYRLKNSFKIDMQDLKEKVNANTRAIFLMHYFGNIQSTKDLDKLKSFAVEHELLIIEDTTHSIFSVPDTVGDYQICSIRKWLPIPKGGVLYARNENLGVFDSQGYRISIDNDRAYGMMLKDMYLKNGYDCNGEYRQIFSRCEERLDQQHELFLISDFARYVVSCVGIDELKKTRVKNYRYLRNALDERKIAIGVGLKEGECPLVLPIWVKDRERFRRYLMDHKVYCAVHWPFDGFQEKERPFAKRCANHLLSLPIDQRYGLAEMDYLIGIIDEFGGDLLY